jgi:hypothetical protein
MKQRHMRYAVIGVICLSTSVLFNNCAGNKAEESGETSQASTPPVTATSFSGKLSANLQYVSSDGRAWGYATDSVNKSSILKVLFYANGPVGTGTYLGQVAAKENGVGTYAGHYFTFKVPPELANGQPQKIYAYAHEAKAAYLISPSPLTFTSYTPKAEAYFTANVWPYIANNCTRCHVGETWSYKNMYFGPLINPLPSNGGTATNNKIIKKMAGLEGHAGGTFCTNGVNADFCANVQNWWRAEFQ